MFFEDRFFPAYIALFPGAAPWCIGFERGRSSDRSRFESRHRLLFRNNQNKIITLQEAYLCHPQKSYLEEKSKELQNSPKWGLAKLPRSEHADTEKVTSVKKKI